MIVQTMLPDRNQGVMKGNKTIRVFLYVHHETYAATINQRIERIFPFRISSEPCRQALFKSAMLAACV